MAASILLAMAVLSIQLTSFGDIAAAGGRLAESPHPRVPLPSYCKDHLEPVDPATIKQRRLICDALRSLDHGEVLDAIDGLNAAGAVPLHEAPNTGAFPYLAVALSLAGDLTGAERALDAALVVILIESGAISCDPKQDFAVARPPLIEGIEESVLADVGGRMCAPMFAHPDYWEKSPAGREAFAETTEAYAWARRRTGLGHPLPR